MRKIDESCILDSCWSKARDSEILFILLARDETAPATIRFWISERIRLGKNRPGDAKLIEAEACAKAMEEANAIRTIQRGLFKGMKVRVFFTNVSGFLDCRQVGDFGPHKSGEIIVVHPEDLEPEGEAP